MALPFTTAGAEDFSSLPQMPETPALDFSEDLHTTPARTKTIVQAYEIWDTQYCELTPMPFLCKKCISSNQQFVRIIEIAPNSAPMRHYECRPFEQPYLY
ncbi:MAG: hypothetical protein KDK33_17645 [Leptospiraceae bacterium]|nr:hypothetical protein [Leptospiraceae bacterium]